jgi:epoxide hydrolase-like predicted phosphatase
VSVTSPPRALLTDYGGVLTSPPAESFRRWLRREAVDAVRFRELMRQWMAPDAATNIVHDLEAGRLAPHEFERRLAAELAGPDGSRIDPTGLLGRMFESFQAEAEMVDVLRRVRRTGVRTALVSNSWGFDYPRDAWDGLFDVVVISGEVGTRKPEPEIYLLTARRLGVPPDACVFVDDLVANVRGAAAVGMIGVHHTSLEGTIDELEILFDRSLR